MSKWRKKPVVIEAFQLVSGQKDIPEWIAEAIQDKRIDTFGSYATIRTLEGDHRANEGDWIIKGVKGELYPIKNDIFLLTYEPVEK